MTGAPAPSASLVALPSAQFAEHVRKDTAKWADVVKRSGASPNGTIGHLIRRPVAGDVGIKTE